MPSNRRKLLWNFIALRSGIKRLIRPVAVIESFAPVICDMIKLEICSKVYSPAGTVKDVVTGELGSRELGVRIGGTYEKSLGRTYVAIASLIMESS